MSSFGSSYRAPYPYRAISTATLVGQVFFLVAVALGFLALGTYLGRHMAFGTARLCSFGGFGMLIVASFGGRTFRVGPFAVVWLYATALLIGLGLGPVIQYFATANPSALTKAAGGTALTVLGVGAAGFAISKDLSPWLRPLSLVLLVAVVIGIVLMITSGGALSPAYSALIYLVSAALLLIDFNILRRLEDEESAVPIATGMFVAIVNIFVSLLNLFGRE
jgi:FtsH-binding integral membrane protein